MPTMWKGPTSTQGSPVKRVYSNVVVSAEFIVEHDEDLPPTLDQIEAAHKASIKQNLWVHLSMPRVISTRPA